MPGTFARASKSGERAVRCPERHDRLGVLVGDLEDGGQVLGRAPVDVDPAVVTDEIVHDRR